MKANKQLSNNEITSFCRQTHYLLQAGITPVNCMDILLEDTKKTSQTEMITQIRDICMEGEKFSTAINRTGCFPKYVVNMINLGEESGHLSSIMDALADYYEREEAISEGIRDAIRYPLIMIGMMLLVILVLIIKVLPIFNQVYAQLGSEMTGFAQSLLQLSSVITRYAFAFIAVIIVAVAVLVAFSRSNKMRQSMRHTFSALPFCKKFTESIASGRFASGMSLTLSSGLDTYESLDLVRDLADNKAMERKIDTCKRSLQEGNTFADAIKTSNIFSAFYTQMVIIGFRSGSIEGVMKQIASQYEEHTNRSIRSLIAILEPTLVIILSLFVGLILLSVIMPLMGIMSMIG